MLKMDDLQDEIYHQNDGLTEPNLVSDRMMDNLNIDLQESFDNTVTLKPPLPIGGKRPPI